MNSAVFAVEGQSFPEVTSNRQHHKITATAFLWQSSFMNCCSDQYKEVLVAKIKGVFCNKDFIII